LEGCRREWTVDPGDGQQLQGAEVLGCGEMTEGGATEPCFDFGGPALQQVVTVNGLSIPVTASDLSEPKRSVEEDVIEGVTVDDSADIPDRCASTTTLSRLRAPTCGSVSKAVTWLRVDFGVNALQEVITVITVNGLSIPVTASRFRMSKSWLRRV